MNQQTMPNITLFDLLARNWQRRAAITHLCFNSDDTLLAISAVDGTVALARLPDNEPPEARIVIDNGQTTIRPREGKPSPLINTRVQEGLSLAAGSNGELIVMTRSGELLRIGHSGEIAAKALADKSPITAFDHCSKTGLTAAVVHSQLRLLFGEEGPIREIDLGDQMVELISISGDGGMIAFAGTGNLGLRGIGGALNELLDIALPSRPLSLRWSNDGKWLACGLETDGLCLVNVTTGENVMLRDFPGPIRTLDWSRAMNAFFASGAYRIAGWSMERPPLSDSATGAIATGQAGFVMVATVAAHPTKSLVAAGYANGRVAVARIGSTEELTVREAGGPVTTLLWSVDGRHLALGDALGSAAIVTFPNEIFK
jgi:WD40 repeat protein